jgi:hypothetical protein
VSVTIGYDYSSLKFDCLLPFVKTSVMISFLFFFDFARALFHILFDERSSVSQAVDVFLGRTSTSGTGGGRTEKSSVHALL